MFACVQLNQSEQKKQTKQKFFSKLKLNKSENNNIHFEFLERKKRKKYPTFALTGASNQSEC